MSVTAHDLRRRTRAGWETAWAVLAGAVTAVGLVTAGLTFGPVVTVLLLLSLAVLVYTALWTVRGEIKMTSAFVTEVSVWAAVVVVVVSGLCSTFKGFGILPLGLLAISSPWTLGALPHVRRRLFRRQRPSRPVGVTTDAELLDRRFRELVAPIDPDDPVNS
jgi:hypothetical protein